MVPDLCESWNSLRANILQLFLLLLIRRQYVRQEQESRKIELIKLTTEQVGRQRNGSHGQIEEFIRKLSTAFRSHDKKGKKELLYRVIQGTHGERLH